MFPRVLRTFYVVNNNYVSLTHEHFFIPYIEYEGNAFGSFELKFQCLMNSGINPLHIFLLIGI